MMISHSSIVAIYEAEVLDEIIRPIRELMTMLPEERAAMDQRGRRELLGREFADVMK